MAALRRDPIGLTTGTQGSNMYASARQANMHGFGIQFQEIDTDTFAGQACDLQQHARLTCMYGRMHIYIICIYEGCKPIQNKQAGDACKPTCMYVCTMHARRLINQLAIKSTYTSTRSNRLGVILHAFTYKLASKVSIRIRWPRLSIYLAHHCVSDASSGGPATMAEH